MHPLAKSKATFLSESVWSGPAAGEIFVFQASWGPHKGVLEPGWVILPLASVKAILLSPKVRLTSCLNLNLGRIGLCSGGMGP